MQICICDDEQVMLKKIHNQVNNTLKNIETTAIVNTFCKGSDLLHYVENNNVDIILLDIEMPEMDGFTVAKKMRENRQKPLVLIFITNRDDLVYDSFEYSPFRFIRKSHLEELENHLLTAINEIRRSAVEITVKVEAGIVTILINDILYIERQGRMIAISTEKEVHMVYQTVSDFEKDFGEDRFIRINEGCIVNFSHISFIKQNNIVLKNGKVLSVSRRRRKETMDKYKLLMR
ncbi:MAG: two component transcriptional regulator, LytTR family [Clostridiales bacterium]|jgi:DNA-binding LytR/AlgR family response regulator|nr:two component transcriptional regulator, LytTR family [Clostridiales bacterium]